MNPDPQQWVDFWSALDESRIWDWNEVYYRSADRIDVPDADGGKDASDDPVEDTDDVISWSVEILLKDGRLVDSSGSNAVPGETRRSRRGRGRGRNRRNQTPTASNQNTGSEAEVPESTAVTADPIGDGNNSGIPDDTFDRFLQALRALLGGREFADDDGELIPEALPTQFRSRTAERKDRPDPFAEEEKSSPKRSRSKRKVRSGRQRSQSSSAPRGEGGSSGRKRSRRGGKKRTGETVASSTAAGGETAKPARKRRRRRRKPGPEGGKPQEGQTPRQDQAPQGDGTARKRKRRRRRRRKPGGDGGGASSGGSTTS